MNTTSKVEMQAQADALPKPNEYIWFIPLGILAGSGGILVALLPFKWGLVALMLILAIFLGFLFDSKKYFLFFFVFSLPVFIMKRIYIAGPPELVGGPSAIAVFLTDIPLLFLAVIFIMRVVRREESIYFPKAVIPIIFLLGWMTLSLLNARSVGLGIAALFFLLRVFFMFILIVNLVRSKKELKLVIVALLAGLFIQIIVTGAQSYFGVWFSPMGNFEKTTWGGGAQPGLFRAGGFLGPTNIQAMYYSLMIPLIFCLLLIRPFIQKLLFMGLFLGVLLAMVLTFSRGGMASAIIAVMVALTLSLRRRLIDKLALSWLVFLTTLVLIAAAVYFPKISPRFLSSESLSPRFELNQIAVRMIEVHPYLGVGLNNFVQVMRDKKYTPLGISPLLYNGIGDKVVPISVHNKYLAVASEAGIPALVFFAWLHFSIMKESWRGTRDADRTLAAIEIGLLSAFFGALVYMFFEVYNSDQFMIFYWSLAGLMIAVSRLSQRQRAES